MIPAIAALWANPLVRRLSMYALAAVAILIAIQVIRNNAYNQGRSEGIIRGLAQAIEEHEEAWAAQQEELAAERAAVETDKQALADEKDSVRQQRQRLDTLYGTELRRIRSELQGIAGDVSTVPASELDRTIRVVLAELRLADFGREKSNSAVPEGTPDPARAGGIP